MKYIIFCQTLYNTVRYINNEMQDYSSMSYNKFLIFLMSQRCTNHKDIKSHLDSFHSVILNLESGIYEKIEPEKTKATFDELLKLNPSQNKKEEQEKGSDKLLEKKAFLQNLFDWRKQNDNTNRYR